MNDFINEFTLKMSQSVEETEKEFIFTTIKDYCETVAEKRISKKVLNRALYWYMTEHKDEYEFLMKEEEE